MHRLQIIRPKFVYSLSVTECKGNSTVVVITVCVCRMNTVCAYRNLTVLSSPRYGRAVLSSPCYGVAVLSLLRYGVAVLSSPCYGTAVLSSPRYGVAVLSLNGDEGVQLRMDSFGEVVMESCCV